MDKPWYDREAFGAMDDFIALQATYRVDSLVSALCRALDVQGLPNGRALTGAERTVIVVNRLEERVNSGGFASFFAQEPTLSPLLIQSLNAVGARECAVLATEAMALPGVERRVSRPDEADDIDTATEAALASIDQRYHARGVAMCDLVWDYAKANRDAISLSEAQHPPASLRGLFGRLLDRIAGRRQ